MDCQFYNTSVNLTIKQSSDSSELTGYEAIEIGVSFPSKTDEQPMWTRLGND